MRQLGLVTNLLLLSLAGSTADDSFSPPMMQWSRDSRDVAESVSEEYFLTLRKARETGEPFEIQFQFEDTETRANIAVVNQKMRCYQGDEVDRLEVTVKVNHSSLIRWRVAQTANSNSGTTFVNSRSNNNNHARFLNPVESPRNRCGHPPAIANAMVHVEDETSAFPIGTILCNKNYVLVGSKDISCRQDGKWQFSGYCKLRMCESQPTIANGRLVNSTDSSSASIGKTAKIVCNDHYKLRGSGNVMCSDAGTWLIDGYCERRFFLLNCELRETCPLRPFMSGSLCVRSCGVSYDEAEAKCKSAASGRGARLALIKTDDDYNLACALLKEPGNAKHVWIGLRLFGRGWLSYGHWQWSDGTHATKTYWLPNEPNNSGKMEDAVEIGLKDNDCGWNDVDKSGFSTPDGFLCEYIY